MSKYNITPEKEAERVRKIKEALKRKRENDPDFYKRRGQAISKAKSTDEAKKKASEIFKKNWENNYEEMCNKIKEAKNSPESKSKYSDIMKEKWKDEEFRKKTIHKHTEEEKKFQSERMKKLWENDDYRNKTSSRIREALNKEETKEKMKCSFKKAIEKDPTILARRGASVSRAKSTPEARKACSEMMKKIHARKEVYDKCSKSQKEMWAKRTPEQKHEILHNLCKNTSDTSIEIKVKKQLDDLGIEYQSQVRFFNNFYIDIYIPSLDLAIECNGDYWHNLPNRKERDNKLLSLMNKSEHNFLVIWEHDIKKSDFDIRDYIKEIQ